ncbi:hypothetical protein [Pseudokineococcus sp. 1T1Z-3]|uniref:hypothetical protein n=1 Tax=Pseudokineococcus sp. 1T1Z-3 TaxID=3132745 RepID=UPI0030ABB3C0
MGQLTVTTLWQQQLVEWDRWLTVAGRPSTTRGLRTYHLWRLAHRYRDRAPFDLTHDDLVGWMAELE